MPEGQWQVPCTRTTHHSHSHTSSVSGGPWLDKLWIAAGTWLLGYSASEDVACRDICAAVRLNYRSRRARSVGRVHVGFSPLAFRFFFKRPPWWRKAIRACFGSERTLIDTTRHDTTRRTRVHRVGAFFFLVVG